MAARLRINSIAKRLQVAFDERTSPQARSERLAEQSIVATREAQTQNSAIVGRAVDYETYVDGQRGASEFSVKPDGVIVHEFSDAIRVGVIQFIMEELLRAAPVRSGQYRQNIRMFVAGSELTDAAEAAKADEVVFTVTVPYARKIEGNKIQGRSRAPASSQAPEGVFAAVTLLAKARFGNSAMLKFTLSEPSGGATMLEEWAGKTGLTRSRWKPGNKRHERTRSQWLRRQPAIVLRWR